MLRNLWGRPPGLRGTPSSRSQSNHISILQSAGRPTGASAAVQGDCPTITAGAWCCENYVALGILPATPTFLSAPTPAGKPALRAGGPLHRRPAVATVH